MGSPRAAPAQAAGGGSSASSSPRSAASGPFSARASAAAAAAAASPLAPAPPRGAGGGSRAVADAGALTASEAAELLLDCVYEFNACVPYSGLSHDAELEPQALAALLALLPEGIQVSTAAGARG